MCVDVCVWMWMCALEQVDVEGVGGRHGVFNRVRVRVYVGSWMVDMLVCGCCGCCGEARGWVERT